MRAIIISALSCLAVQSQVNLESTKTDSGLSSAFSVNNIQRDLRDLLIFFPFFLKEVINTLTSSAGKRPTDIKLNFRLFKSCSLLE